MDPVLKQRLVGATVLVALGVIFIPMLLDGSGETELRSVPVSIPPEPRPSLTDLPPVVQPEPGAERLPAPGLDNNPRTPPVAFPEEIPAAVPAGSGSPPPTATATAIEPRGREGVAPHRGNASDLEGFVVQVGSFTNEAAALALRDRLRGAGFTTFVEPVRHGGQEFFRVRVGPELERAGAERLAVALRQQAGVSETLVQRHP